MQASTTIIHPGRTRERFELATPETYLFLAYSADLPAGLRIKAQCDGVVVDALDRHGEEVGATWATYDEAEPDEPSPTCRSIPMPADDHGETPEKAILAEGRTDIVVKNITVTIERNKQEITTSLTSNRTNELISTFSIPAP